MLGSQHDHSRVFRWGVSVAVAALAAVVSANSATLPGGTALSTAMTSPADGVTVLPGASIPVSGAASVGEGLPIPDTLLIYVLDLSGSTVSPVATTLCGNQNAPVDATANTILDCEIAAVKALNNAAISLGTVGEVAAVGFGGHTSLGSLNDAFILDLSPDAALQHVVAPDADLYNPGVQPDLYDALANVGIGAGLLFTPFNTGTFTNYWAAVTDALAAAGESALPNKRVIFLSDGTTTSGGPSGEGVTQALAGVTDVTFDTFAIGNLAECDPAGAHPYGTLQQISDLTGGTCTSLANPEDAIDVLPQVIAAKITGLGLSVDGGAPLAVTPSATLPVSGPGSVSWDATVGPLASGTHELCGSASGSDGGGTGSVSDCVTIHVDTPPTCDGVAPSRTDIWPVNKQLVPVTLAGATDPDGDPLTLAITGVTQDEAPSPGGDGALVSAGTVDLRAARAGDGDGRVYRIAFEVTDSIGASCTGTVVVGVPHDQRGASAVDSGASYPSLP